MSFQPMAPPGSPPVTAPPPAPRPVIKPSKAWYWIGALLIAAGVLTAIGLFVGWVVTTSHIVDNFARVKVPPEGQQVALDFKKPGEYRIYYEWRSEADGERVNNKSSDPPSQLDITVAAPDGSPIDVKPDDNDFSFSFNDKFGQAVSKIDIPAAGNYTMSVTSNATEPFVIAVGKGVLHTIWPWWLLGMIAAFVVGVGLGLLAIILTAVKRGRRKKELRRAQQPYGTPVYGTPAYGTPAYPAPYTAPPAPTWTEPPATTPGWGAPSPTDTPAPPSRPDEPLPAPNRPPPSDDQPWAPPRP
jgi:hypothetical protein